MFNFRFPFQIKSHISGVLFAGLLALVTVFAGPLSAVADTGFTGKVTDLSLAPLSGILVQVLDVNGIEVAEAVTTQADGTYAYGGLPADTFRIRFQSLDPNNPAPAVFYANKLDLGFSDTLTLTSGVVTPGIDAVIGAWGQISGQVTNTSNIGIPGIQVQICDQDGVAISSLPAVTTKADGRYVVGGINPALGPYKVRFYGNSLYAGQWFANAATSAAAIPVPVFAYQTTYVDQKLEMLPGISVAGKVTNALGAPIPNIKVYIFDVNFNSFPLVDGVLAPVNTLSDGTYSITGAPSGDYVVAFQDLSPTPVYQKQYYSLKTTRPAPNVTVTTGTPRTGIDAVLLTVAPGAPTAVSASAGNGQAIVSFAPPAFTGVSAITGYTVTSSPGGITKTGSSSPLTVTGLANGTSYTFTVTATNTGGTGAASVASSLVTPMAPVNGVCGSANGGSFISVPTSNLCSAGTASSVSGGGSWNWTCGGTNGGLIATCSAILQRTLGLTFAGTGGGSVSGDLSCLSGSACSPGVFNTGSPANLLAAPNAISTFSGWSGACTGTTANCSITMDGDKAVTASFTMAPKAKISTTGYDSLTAAYNGATSIATILTLDSGMPDAGLILNLSKTITIKGGYKTDYSARTGLPTLLDGPLKISKGKLAVDNLVVR